MLLIIKDNGRLSSDEVVGFRYEPPRTGFIDPYASYEDAVYNDIADGTTTNTVTQPARYILVTKSGGEHEVDVTTYRTVERLLSA